MSCNVEYRTYKNDKKFDRKMTETELNYYVSCEAYREGAHGLPCCIKWRDDIKPFLTMSEAQDYIEDVLAANNRYTCVAVRFYGADSADEKADKMFNDLIKRKCESSAKYDALSKDLYIKTLSSKTITCKECGCGIPTARWNSNFCPVCRTDIRPASLRARVEKGRKDLEEMNKKLEVRSGEIGRKLNKTYWFVRIAYHT